MSWTTPKTWTPGEVVTATDLNTHLRDNLSAVLPIGTLIYRVMNYSAVETTVEGRWLYCNGVAVSRTTYSDLFDYFNALTPALPFGNGDGSATFNLPDTPGRQLVAIGTHASVDALGDSEGSSPSNRRPQHYHNSQYGGASVGGTYPVGAAPGQSPALDNTITRLVPTSPGSAGNILDTGAFLVAGIYLIKYIV